MAPESWWKRWLPSLLWFSFVGTVIWTADKHLGRAFFTWIEKTPGSDKIGHFLLIGTMALLLNLSLRGRQWRFLGRPWLAGSVIVLILFTLEEFSQQRIPWRHFDYADLAADYAGIFVFGAIARWILRRRTQL